MQSMRGCRGWRRHCPVCLRPRCCGETRRPTPLTASDPSPKRNCPLRSNIANLTTAGRPKAMDPPRPAVRAACLLQCSLRIAALSPGESDFWTPMALIGPQKSGRVSANLNGGRVRGCFYSQATKSSHPCLVPRGLPEQNYPTGPNWSSDLSPAGGPPSAEATGGGP